MKYIYKDIFIRNNEILFITSLVIIILIIILLIYMGIKVIKKKWQLIKFHTICVDH